METVRKRRLDGGECEEAKKPRRPAATEEEVEEFFAILRRVREARRCLAVTARRATWQPAFAREDFEEVSGVRDDSEKVTTVATEEENVCKRRFDLNAEPAAEGVATSEI